MADHNADIVRLVTARNPAQAHLWQQVLEEEGIKAQVVGDFLDAGIGDIPGVSAEVWVHRADVARAQAILESQSSALDEQET